MLEKRREWIGKRFGDIDESILGRVEEAAEMVWPDLVQEYEVGGNRLVYKMVSDIHGMADRVAEIFKNGAHEMIGNREIEWHHDPEQIVGRVQTGDWQFYGCCLNGDLIAVESLHIVRGDRIMEWVWGCVDPIHRGKGVWRNIGVYTDLIAERSGAQVGSVWVVTTHKYSQMSVEKAGYTPMGCFIGKRFYGGADRRYYRHTLIHYAKLYDMGKRHLQNWESMHLTEKAARLVTVIREFWDESR